MTPESDRTNIENDQRMYFQDFSQIFAQTGFGDLAAVAKSILSIDVGNGPEIGAFGRLNPQLFVATEPRLMHEDEGDINKSLKVLGKLFPVTILRDFSFDAIKKLQEQRKFFGLITRLYMFPERARYDGICQFVEACDRILQPGGVIAMSVERPRHDGDFVGFVRSAGYLSHPLGYDIDIIDPQKGYSCGGLFVFGRKPA